MTYYALNMETCCHFWCQFRQPIANASKECLYGILTFFQTKTLSSYSFFLRSFLYHSHSMSYSYFLVFLFHINFFGGPAISQLLFVSFPFHCSFLFPLFIFSFLFSFYDLSTFLTRCLGVSTPFSLLLFPWLFSVLLPLPLSISLSQSRSLLLYNIRFRSLFCNVSVISILFLCYFLFTFLFFILFTPIL